MAAFWVLKLNKEKGRQTIIHGIKRTELIIAAGVNTSILNIGFSFNNFWSLKIFLIWFMIFISYMNLIISSMDFIGFKSIVKLPHGPGGPW